MRYFLLAVVAATMSLPTMASVEQAVRDCAKVDNSQQRLACFDKLSASLSVVSHAENISPTPTKAPEAPKTEVTTTQAVEEFGAQRIKEETTPEQIELTIASVSKNAYGVMTITFTNGQVWKQKSSKRYRLKAQDKVIIEKAAFGSFLLSVEGRNGSIRVQREK